MKIGHDYFDEAAIDPSRARVSELRWFVCLHNYLADIGRDQDLADALIEAGMAPADAVGFMRALLTLSTGLGRRRGKTRGAA